MAPRSPLTLFMLAGLSAIVVCPLARADEAFLCGPDRVVYVKPSQLEQKKKSDPCIARYFGLTVEEPTPEAPAAQPALEPAPKTVQRKSSAATKVALKALASPEVAERLASSRQKTAQLEPVVAAPGADYRNVRVLNAASPAEQWFKHTR